jgi:hypothetical protein
MAERPTADELINRGLSSPRGVDPYKLDLAIRRLMDQGQFIRNFGFEGVTQKIIEMTKSGLVIMNDLGKYKWAGPGANKY